MKYQIRNRTKLEDISYGLHLYFNGLSLRNTTKALSRFVHRSHIAIRDWIQKYKLNIPISTNVLNNLSWFLLKNTKAIYHLCIYLSVLNVIVITDQSQIG
jgi:hypothetical protein